MGDTHMDDPRRDGLDMNATSPARHKRFNGDMLTTAREALFLSQGELANTLGVSQPLVGRWEVESSQPNDSQIDLLSRKLAIRREFFFIDRPRRLASMSDYYHRSFAKASRKAVKAIHARCNIIDIQIDRLLQLGEVRDDLIPDIDPIEDGHTPEQIAALAREAMDVGPGPIPDLVAVIERCGGIVIDRNLEIDDMDALCRWVPELPKLFFLNGAKPPDRIRHSLAHELGHTVMHFGRDLDYKIAEDQANKFAAAFLMPARDIRKDFRGSVTLADLAAIKRKWRVAMQSAAMRALAIGAIDKRQHKWLFVQFSSNGWRKSEPVSIQGETPTTFANLLQQHLDKGVSRSDLASLLLVSEETIGKMLIDAHSPTYYENGVRLRVVRD